MIAEKVFGDLKLLQVTQPREQIVSHVLRAVAAVGISLGAGPHGGKVYGVTEVPSLMRFPCLAEL